MITWRVELADPRAHLYRVTLTVPRPQPGQRLSLPVWIPGSYLVREFARHLASMRARQGGTEVALRQLDKCTWVADTRGQAALVVSFDVYAFDTSVRTAWLDERRAFFNGTSLFLRVEGREQQRHRVVLGRLPRGWQVATAMSPVDGASHTYEAADYDEFVDHPFEIGEFWRGGFRAGGVNHEFVISGAWPGFDGERLLADVKQVCEQHIAFWHGAAAGRGHARGGVEPPFAHYLFLLNLVDDGYGGLEHRASTALIAARRDMPRRGQAMSDGYATLLGLVSHEYFHAWNVKRMKPLDLARIDYGRENYTELLWFFEGFTSYYDDLALVRSGLIDEARYLRLLGKAIDGVSRTPGRQVQSVAQASFDAWTRYYRPDENTPNATVSYYAKGSLVALALDLTLRESGATLDDVLRDLWRTSGGGPIDEGDIAAALARAGGRSFESELARWVHGTDELPLAELLASHGLALRRDAATLAQQLGLRVAEGPVSGVQVKAVLRGGPAEQAGVAAGDEILAVAGWRVRRLDDALMWAGGGVPLELLLVRDQRIFRVVVTPQAEPAGTLSVAVRDKSSKAETARRRAWLGA